MLNSKGAKTLTVSHCSELSKYKQNTVFFLFMLKISKLLWPCLLTFISRVWAC